MEKNKPEFVYFDLGNVLLNFDHEIACTNLGRICNRTPSQIRKVIFESTLQHKYESGQVSTEEFHQAFCEQLGVTAAIDEVCLAASAIFTPNYSAIPLVTQLNIAGTRLGILSNTCQAHWDYLFDGRYCFLNELFQKYVLSFEVGSSKPEPGIYEAAAQLAGFEPHQIFFVDDRAENVAAATEIGFDAVLFQGSLTLAKDLISRQLLRTI